MFKWEVIRQSNVWQLPEGGDFEAIMTPFSIQLDEMVWSKGAFNFTKHFL